ncbi:peroxidase-related enzyme [Natrarchaeobaculum aegyptiacum]|uniref:Alkylhydroperoxidase n=1 Tax=Natrarchaeobaculum aegyptiacum TaxID=745377 RepID=A0A2Z2HSN6_9EURY|nr:peroxidase-related enzyme [Natrarchaeobaculum aegyptiacum]ARS88407.1 alkylhydroperoxidase [Natrarchaeobaculum aegyptiacum]
MSDTDSTPTLADDAMMRLPVPSFEDLPEDLQDRIATETERSGFTPNVFAALAYKPAHFRPFFDFHDAIVDESALEREEIEMIVVAVSGVNDCYYCSVAHGALVRIYADDPHLADQLLASHRIADVGAAHRAMLDLAVKLTEEPAAVEEGDLERLREAGFSEEAIWDIAVVTAYYNMSNRLASFADMRPNEEFHTLGR